MFSLGTPGQTNSENAPRLRLSRKTFLLTLAIVLAGGLSLGMVLIFLAEPVGVSPDPVVEPAVRNGLRYSGEVEPPNAERERLVGADVASVVDDAPVEQLEIPERVTADPRFAFLLLGYGGGSHDGANLTDSIMVAIADPAQKSLTLLSIPRDSWVPLLFDGKTAVYNRINTAYALAKDPKLYPNRVARYAGKNGPGNLSVDTVSRSLGIPISNYVGIDFQGFRQMIDAVGGIDVDVPASFSALYPANDDPSIDPSWITVRFARGIEHMNGERAIRFARARETIDNISEGSDFARARRQRIIMEAFKARLFEPGGLLHLPQILAIAARRVDTDYEIGAVGQFAQLLLDWKNVQVYQAALTTANYLVEGTGYGGAYVLVPRAQGFSWAQIRAFARRLWEDPATGVAMANTQIVVVNNTGKSGAATRLSETLARLGYRVAPPQTGTVRAKSRVVDRSGGRARLVIDQLGRDLGVRFPEVAEAPTAKSSEELVLELGADDAAVADLEVSVDDAAPSSKVGIVEYGRWLPATPTPAPETSATPSAIASGTPGTPPPGTTGTPGTPSPRLSVTPGTPRPGADGTPGTAAPSASGTSGTAVPRASGTPGTPAPKPSGTPGTPAPSASGNSGTPLPGAAETPGAPTTPSTPVVSYTPGSDESGSSPMPDGQSTATVPPLGTVPPNGTPPPQRSPTPASPVPNGNGGTPTTASPTQAAPKPPAPSPSATPTAAGP